MKFKSYITGIHLFFFFFVLNSFLFYMPSGLNLTNNAIGADNFYYVATDGSDNNPGTDNKPFATIQKAADTANEGDTVFIKYGIYRPQDTINLYKPGVKYKAYNLSKKPIIDTSHFISNWTKYSTNIYKGVLSKSVDIHPIVFKGKLLRQASNLSNVDQNKYFQDNRNIYIYSTTEPNPAKIGLVEAWYNWNDAKDTIVLSASNITINGLIVRYASGNGLLTYADNTTIKNSEFLFNNDKGIYIGASDNNKVQNCSIHDNVLQNWPRKTRLASVKPDCALCWGQGLTFYSGKNSIAENNEIYRNNGEGVGSWGDNNYKATSGLIIRNNVIYDNYSVNIYIDGSKDVEILKNFTYTTGNLLNPDDYRSVPAGLKFSWETDRETNSNWDTALIANNIVYACAPGIYLNPYHTSEAPKDYTIINNSVIVTDNSNWNPALVITKGSYSNLNVKNNLFYSTQANMAEVSISHMQELHIRNNLWYSESTSVGNFACNSNYTSFKDWNCKGSNSLWNKDPLFLGNTLGTSTNLYKIDSSSPTVDSGITLTNITTDYQGTNRPQGDTYDIGAFEAKVTIQEPEEPDIDNPLQENPTQEDEENNNTNESESIIDDKTNIINEEEVNISEEKEEKQNKSTNSTKESVDQKEENDITSKHDKVEKNTKSTNFHNQAYKSIDTILKFVLLLILIVVVVKYGSNLKTFFANLLNSSNEKS